MVVSCRLYVVGGGRFVRSYEYDSNDSFYFMQDPSNSRYAKVNFFLGIRRLFVLYDLSAYIPAKKVNTLLRFLRLFIYTFSFSILQRLFDEFPLWVKCLHFL